MGNSVLDAIEPKDEVAELKLLISGYHSCEKFAVLVEGKDDVLVYEKLFSEDKVEVCPTYGCSELVKLVDSLNQKGYGKFFIGIKDADYDLLNHVHHAWHNLFLTDTHDLETMMIDEDITGIIMKENLDYMKMKNDEKVLDNKAFLKNVLDIIKPLSYIRWYNDVNDCKINFGVCKIASMIKEDAALGYACCLKYINKDSSNASISLTVNDFISFESSNSENVDIMLLVRGHDMCEVMSVLLHQHDYYDKNSKLNGAKIEKNIRLCYTKEKFKSTQLYTSLHNWFKGKKYEGMLSC